MKRTFDNNINNFEEKIQETKNIITKFKMIKLINAHDYLVNSVSIFPSGKIISVSYDKSIKIYDINYNIIQNIKNAHNNGIIYVDIKDENNFVTCSDDKSIKTWIKNNNEFILNKNINNAHNDCIYKVIYYSNKNLISCSFDKTTKIWEEKDKNYQLVITLMHSNWLYSILLIKDKNILISSGFNETKLWNLNNFELIKNFDKVKCNGWNALSRIDEDRIIIGGNKILLIISLLKKTIIKEISIFFYCYGIKTIKKKGLFLVGGEKKDIILFRNINYECIQIFKNIHDDYINGFIELQNNLFGSYSNDGKIKIWTF